MQYCQNCSLVTSLVQTLARQPYIALLLRQATTNTKITATSDLHKDCFLPLQECQPLWLKASNGSTFKFVGAAELLKGNVSADAALVPPDAVGDLSVEPLTPAQLANQVQLRAREFLRQYYDGYLKSDDELLPIETRNVCLRSQNDAKPGTAPPNVGHQGHMSRVYGESELYTQLANFARLLDVQTAARQLDEKERDGAMSKLGGIRTALDQGLQAIRNMQNASAYRWVSLHSLYDIKATAG